jgi:hypothetical protein
LISTARLSLLLVLTALVLPACGAEPKPEEEARKLVNLLKYADQEGFDAVQEDLFGMLSQASQAMVERQCAPAMEALKASKANPPASCLVFRGFPLGRTLKTVERVDGSAARVRLKLVMEGGPVLLDLVKEEGRWKLDLEGGFELAPQAGAKGVSGDGHK